MKALLVNTELNLIRDIGTKSTLFKIKNYLEDYGWCVEYFVATTYDIYKKKMMEFHPDITLCYDYKSMDGIDLRKVNTELKIPDIFVSSDLLEIFLNKQSTKDVALEFNFKTPESMIVRRNTDHIDIPFSPPYFVKPLHGGDSRGIYHDNVFTNKEELIKYINSTSLIDDDYLIEEFINNDHSSEIAFFLSYYPNHIYYSTLRYHYSLPVNQTYKYLSKTIKDYPSMYSAYPEIIDYPYSEEIIDKLIQIFNKWNTYGIIKSEFIERDSALLLIEVNGIPGLNHCFKHTSIANKISENEYINKIFMDALQK